MTIVIMVFIIYWLLNSTIQLWYILYKCIILLILSIGHIISVDFLLEAIEVIKYIMILHITHNTIIRMFLMKSALKSRYVQ